ncbi:MAG: PIN domain-containing protein [Bdellovibrionota bacterium]
MAVLVDTGALYAYLDKHDRWHPPAKTLFENSTEAFLVPQTVLPEACYLIRRALGTREEQAFVENLSSDRFLVIPLMPQDFPRILELLRRYENLRLDFVDASVIAVAERLRIKKVATTDRRDFALVRPVHCEKFELVP